jgi:peroxiredoxin
VYGIPPYNGGMRRRLLLLAFAVSAACGPPPQASEKAQPAPAFDVPDLGGGRATLASLKGKVVVLDFWATWCGPCLVELPQYNDFARQYRPRGSRWWVWSSTRAAGGQDFVREHRVEYRQLLGNDAMMDAFGGNMGFPTTFVIDREGTIRTKFVGSTPDKFERLQKAVDAAL